MALEQPDGIGVPPANGAAAGRPPQGRRQPEPPRAAGQVRAVVARRAPASPRRPRRAGGGAGRALPRHRHRALRRGDRRRAHLRSPAGGAWPRSDLPPERTDDHPAGTPPGGLPDRLRPGRQRSQGGRGDRRPGHLQRRDGVGPLPPARSPVPLRRDHGLPAQGRPAPAPGRRHRRQRRRRLRAQPGEVRLPVPRSVARGVRRAGSRTSSSRSSTPGATSRSRWSTTAP